MNSMIGLGLLPSFLIISSAMPNVNEAPLPPAMRITLSAVLEKFGMAPYGPSIEALKIASGFFIA